MKTIKYTFFNSLSLSSSLSPLLGLYDSVVLVSQCIPVMMPSLAISCTLVYVYCPAASYENYKKEKQKRETED